MSFLAGAFVVHCPVGMLTVLMAFFAVAVVCAGSFVLSIVCLAKVDPPGSQTELVAVLGMLSAVAVLAQLVMDFAATLRG
jgi:hypothetical protein